MAEIKIKSKKHGNFVVLVDDSDYEELSQYCWRIFFRSRNVYVKGYVNGIDIFMHRHIMKTPKGMLTDHKDGNGLNNKRDNLRICNFFESNQNRLGQNAKSGYKGVTYRPCSQSDKKPYEVRIRANDVIIQIGRYSNAKEAALKYNEAAKKHHGDYANLNKITQ